MLYLLNKDTWILIFMSYKKPANKLRLKFGIIQEKITRLLNVYFVVLNRWRVNKHNSNIKIRERTRFSLEKHFFKAN